MKLLVIDGNSIVNRAFFGMHPLNNREGVPTHAIFGFLNILRRMEEETGDTQTLKGRSVSVSVESPGVHKVLFEFSECLWWVWGLILNVIFFPSSILLELLICP